jgi:electron transfer flavoprotein alpha subunit
MAKYYLKTLSNSSLLPTNSTIKYHLSESDTSLGVRTDITRTYQQCQSVRRFHTHQNNHCQNRAPVSQLLVSIAEEITHIIKSLVGQGGYKNVIGLSSSLGKDVIPRAAGLHAAQPISDIIEVSVSSS